MDPLEENQNEIFQIILTNYPLDYSTGALTGAFGF